jgi:mono/diheme cytochrome c family protein
VPLLVLLLPACQQQMAVQPSYRPDQPSGFFSDGRAARPLVAGTVARGHLRTDLQLFAGTRGSASAPVAAAGALGTAPSNLPMALALVGTLASQEEGDPVKEFPFPVTDKVLEHGKNRYMIYCVVCHDPLGTGRGMIVQRGYTPPPSYHIERLRQAPPGHFFQVITKGYGSMPSYRKQVPPRDRWAIAAYIRALQLSQHFPEKELTRAMRDQWAEQKKQAGGPPR